MNRFESRWLAETRVLEAKALLEAGHWSGTYHLVGYAVEGGLKACVLAHVERSGAIFEDRKFSEKCWTHDIEELIKVAGLKPELGLELSSNLDLSINWTIVKDWSEVSRYQEWTEPATRKLFEAITHSNHGVLSWTRNRW